MPAPSLKPVIWLGDSLRELVTFPAVVQDEMGYAFRSVYTVRFADRVFVLHAFQKKSKSGLATPKADLDLIKQRLKQATEISRKKE